MTDRSDPMLDALALQLVARHEKSPVERFVDSIQDPGLRRTCRETVELRRELERRLQSMLSTGDWHASMGEARWVADHVQDVQHRWLVLMRAVERWLATDVQPFRLTVRP